MAKKLKQVFQKTPWIKYNFNWVCWPFKKNNKQLRRFSNLSPKTKTILVKTLLIPVMTYPSIPICTASQTQKRKM